MTNSLPLITLVTLISTNWVNIPGDFRRESGTNYTQQRQLVFETNYVQQVTLCTNLVPYKWKQETNSPTRWHPVQNLTPPPLPGQFEKP